MTMAQYDEIVAEARLLLFRGMRDTLIEAVTDKAIEYGSTINGAGEVYLCDGHSIPWCSEDEMQAWWANQ